MKMQRNNQQSQVNACFYRLKYRASAVVLCDVDEYVHSEKYPFDLPEVVRYTRRTHPEYDLVTVVVRVMHNVQMGANRYTNKENDLSQREKMLEEGKLFDAYQYRLNTYASGAFKMIAFNDFNGMLSLHVCFFCTAWKNIPLEYARVAHFKVMVYNGTYEHSTTLSSYSPLLRQEIAALKKNALL